MNFIELLAYIFGVIINVVIFIIVLIVVLMAFAWALTPPCMFTDSGCMGTQWIYIIPRLVAALALTIGALYILTNTLLKGEPEPIRKSDDELHEIRSLKRRVSEFDRRLAYLESRFKAYQEFPPWEKRKHYE